MSRRLLGLLVAVACCVASSWVAAGPASAVGPYTSWSVAGDHGDFPTGGARYDFDASSGISVEGDATEIDASVETWTLRLVPAQGDRLAAGRTYAGATRVPFQEPDEPGLDLSGRYRGCNTLTGSFTIHEITFTPSGAVESVVLTAEQHCSGNAPAAYVSIAWRASQPAPPLPPTVPAPPVPPALVVKIEARRTAFGQPFSVEVRLAAGSSTNREVAVFARTADGQERLLTRGDVDATGRLAVTTTLTETTTFVARLASDGTVPGAEALSSVAVSVPGRLRIAVSSRGRERGRTRLFDASRRVRIATRLDPDHAGDCVKFKVQFRVRGSWGYDTRSRCLELDRRSVVTARLDGDPRLVGIPIRVRSEWKGDERNTRTVSRWVQVEFVRS